MWRRAYFRFRCHVQLINCPILFKNKFVASRSVHSFYSISLLPSPQPRWWTFATGPSRCHESLFAALTKFKKKMYIILRCFRCWTERWKFIHYMRNGTLLWKYDKVLVHVQFYGTRIYRWTPVILFAIWLCSINLLASLFYFFERTCSKLWYKDNNWIDDQL